MFTSDALFDGKLIIRQEKGGYRFSLDAVLLAELTRVKPCDRVVDLGTGCGVILLILAFRKLGKDLVGLEIQPELATLAKKNVDENAFADRIRIDEMDFRNVPDHLPAESFQLVVSNPPYRKLNTGRINPHGQRAVARHEVTASVADVFEAGKHLLPHGGRLAIIYPATRLDTLMITAHRHGFSPKELTLIHSDTSGSARLVHMECRKGGGEELRIAPPLFIYREDGTYTEAMQAMYRDQGAQEQENGRR